MIEVLFGDSEAGLMKAVQHIEDVICLNFLLDIGDIRQEIDSPYRKDLIYNMYAQEQWGKNPEIDAELKRAGELYCRELSRLQEHISNGASIRIWYSKAPYALCGLYHLCSMLQNRKNDVCTIALPDYIVHSGHIVQLQNWGEVSPENLASFLSCQTRLSTGEIRMYAWLWNELKTDNSPLRAVVNGRLIGVPENFYDFILWKHLSETPVKEARLIGDLLGQNQISVRDWWYAKRIDHYIAQGRIRILEDSENKYARIISAS